MAGCWDVGICTALIIGPGRGWSGGRGRGPQPGSFNSMQANVTAGQMAGMQLNSPGQLEGCAHFEAVTMTFWQARTCTINQYTSHLVICHLLQSHHILYAPILVSPLHKFCGPELCKVQVFFCSNSITPCSTANEHGCHRPTALCCRQQLGNADVLEQK